MYKLILMDFSMPNCDGPTATKLIRKFIAEHSSTSNQLRQPYICFMTAYGEKKMKRVAEGSGCNNYLVKPVFKGKLH